jgi:hypothetical protein
MLCDDCAALDGRWGIRVDDQASLVAEQQKRRERYLRTHSTDSEKLRNLRGNGNEW